MQKKSQSKRKTPSTPPRAKRFVVDVTPGPFAPGTAFLRPGVWYSTDGASWSVATEEVHATDVLRARDERQLDALASTVMDEWEAQYEGSWAFCVSAVVRDRETGELRRKP